MRDEVYLVTGSSYDGWEDSSWGIVSGETGLAHTGAIVNYKGRYVIVTHSGGVSFVLTFRKMI